MQSWDLLLHLRILQRFFYATHIKWIFKTRSSTTMKSDTGHWKFSLLPKGSPPASRSTPLDPTRWVWHWGPVWRRPQSSVAGRWLPSEVGTQDLLVIRTCKESHHILPESRCCLSTHFGSDFTVFWARAWFRVGHWVGSGDWVGTLFSNTSYRWIYCTFWLHTTWRHRIHTTQQTVRRTSPRAIYTGCVRNGTGTGIRWLKKKKSCNAHHIKILQVG